MVSLNQVENSRHEHKQYGTIYTLMEHYIRVGLMELRFLGMKKLPENQTIFDPTITHTFCDPIEPKN